MSVLSGDDLMQERRVVESSFGDLEVYEEVRGEEELERKWSAETRIALQAASCMWNEHNMLATFICHSNSMLCKSYMAFILMHYYYFNGFFQLQLTSFLKEWYKPIGFVIEVTLNER